MTSKYYNEGILTNIFESYCLACECFMRSEEDTDRHIEKGVHKRNLASTCYFDGYEEDRIRKVPAGYFCELCNILLFTPLKVSLHIIDALHRNNKGCHFLKRMENDAIVFDNVMIDDDSWNCIKDNSCCLCDTEFENKEIHKSQREHYLNLIRTNIEFGYPRSIYRVIEDAFQCLICNVLLPLNIIKTHWEDLFHKENVRKRKVFFNNSGSQGSEKHFDEIRNVFYLNTFWTQDVSDDTDSEISTAMIKKVQKGKGKRNKNRQQNDNNTESDESSQYFDIDIPKIPKADIPKNDEVEHIISIHNSVKKTDYEATRTEVNNYKSFGTMDSDLTLDNKQGNSTKILESINHLNSMSNQYKVETEDNKIGNDEPSIAISNSKCSDSKLPRKLHTNRKSVHNEDTNEGKLANNDNPSKKQSDITKDDDVAMNWQNILKSVNSIDCTTDKCDVDTKDKNIINDESASYISIPKTNDSKYPRKLDTNKNSIHNEGTEKVKPASNDVPCEKQSDKPKHFDVANNRQILLKSVKKKDIVADDKAVSNELASTISNPNNNDSKGFLESEVKNILIENTKIQKNTNNLNDESSKIYTDEHIATKNDTTANRQKILNSAQEFAKSEININFETETSYCKKCFENIDFNFDVITQHIKEDTEYNKKRKVTDYVVHQCEVDMKVKEIINKDDNYNTIFNLEDSKSKGLKSIDSNAKSTHKENNKNQKKPVDFDDPVLLAKENNLTYNKSNTNAFCRTCNVRIPASLKCMKEHVNGAKHKRAVIEAVKKSEERTRTFIMKPHLRKFATSILTVINILSGQSTGIIINQKFYLSSLSFFMISDIGSRMRCLLCEERVDPRLVDSHGHSNTHAEAMFVVPVMTCLIGEFVRELHRNLYHCGFCNILLSNWEELKKHLKCDDHNSHKRTAEILLKHHLSRYIRRSLFDFF